jgi:hypothetical protein
MEAWMRNGLSGLSAAILAVVVAGCQRTAMPGAVPQSAAQTPAPAPVSRPAPTVLPEQVNFKGMELYSLRAADGRWYYYVLGGTNRQKKLSEVTSASPAVGTDAVKVYLRSLPPGSTLAWSMQVIVDRTPNANLGLPDAETVKQIRDVCRQSGIDLKLPSATATTAAFRR